MYINFEKTGAIEAKFNELFFYGNFVLVRTSRKN